MIKVGITGQSGFVGTHLYNTLGLYPGEFERVPFEDDYFVDVERLKTFVKTCDVIVHLAAARSLPERASTAARAALSAITRGWLGS